MLELNFSVNYPAIATAVIASFIVGWVWYSPALFGKVWQKSAGLTNAQLNKGVVNTYTAWAVSSIILAFILDNLLIWMDAKTAADGLLIAFWLWLGFVVTTMTISYNAARRPKASLWVDASNQLLCMLIMGAILAVWL